MNDDGLRHGRPAPLRVLIVEDNRDGADSLAMLLETVGHQVDIAYDGFTALDTAATFRPDAVLLDLGLPRLNGYELARALRARPDPPVLIAVTGWARAEDRAAARDAGCEHYLLKPFDLEALELVLRHVVPRPRE